MASPSGISIRSIGLIAAAGLALVFIAVIAASIFFSKPAGNTTPNVFPTDPRDIIDIEDTQQGGKMFVTMVDQNDPTRVASTLRAERFEPIGDGRRRLDRPESWIYLKDGRAIRVNADYATMLMPDPNQAPESGTLEGNIVLRSYDSTPAPGQPAPDDQAPTLTARFDQPVEFERRYLRMSSNGRFEIESKQVDFSGTNLTVILNNLRNRIELIDVEQGDQLVIHTSKAPPSSPESTTVTAASEEPPNEATPEAAPNTPPTLAQSSPAETTPAEPPVATEQATTQRYIVTLDEQVHARVANSGSVDADTLELWAAFIDGKLPDNAIRTIALAQSTEQSTSPRAAQGPTTPPATTPTTPTSTNPREQGTPEPAPSNTQNDLVITWSGPMRVRPIDGEIPTQLEHDHIAMRLSGKDNRSITMQAPQRGFTGHAQEVTYSATRAIAHFKGDDTSQERMVQMQVDQSGTLLASDMRIDLAAATIELNQRGQITTLHDDPTQTASVRWKDNAQIRFALDADGGITQRLASARFEGNAVAEQDGNSIGARVIHATLDPDLPSVSALKRLELSEGVIASANKSMLSGQQLTIDFVPSSTPEQAPQPTRVVSIGSALGRTPDAMLQADEMSADLIRDDLTGQTRIKAAQARGSVSYRDSKRTTAQAQQLQADGLNEVITLTGEGTQVTQAGSSIAGNHIVLRAKRRGVEVVGPGTFDHDIALVENPNAQPGQSGHIRASWVDSMRFDDTLGTINCTGKVKVISTPDALTRDTLSADRMTINLTPMPSADPVAGSKAPQRQLLSARASGRAEPGKAPEPASIESRTYSAVDPERATGVLYLEGAQISADNQKQTLEVPGAGTLLILDRPEQDDSTATQPTDRSLDGSGLTRFTWTSKLLLERAIGKGTFTGGVVVDHKSLNNNKLAKLSTDTLIARFATNNESPETDPLLTTGNTLQSATAQGHVRFVFEGRELLSDNAQYDAIEDSLFASSLDNSLVTLYDNTQPAPISARTISWDLKNDQFKMNAPSPIRTTPGG